MIRCWSLCLRRDCLFMRTLSEGLKNACKSVLCSERVYVFLTHSIKPDMLREGPFTRLITLGCACILLSSASGYIPPSSPLRLVFVGNPGLAESSQIATDLASRLGPHRIHFTYLPSSQSLDSLTLSSYHAVYLYANTSDSRVQHHFKNSSLPEPLIPERAYFILVEATDHNSAFIKGDSFDYTAVKYALGEVPELFDEDFIEAQIEQITWIAGEEAVAQWESKAPPALSYVTPEVPIPNYENPEEEPLKQEPLPPEHTLAYTQVPEGFEVTLFASEPEIVNPIAMNWDERGRLWVLETLDYPNNKYPLGEGNDSIKILEDTNSDGRADKITVFADNLSIATGFTFVNDGVLVSAPPEMLFLKDNNDDDVADEQKVLFDGFLTFDTHAGVSNLRYGFDNWIWMAIGYAGFEGEVGDEQHRFKQGLFRLKPDASELDYLSHFSNNTWGLGFSENGDVFASTANNEPSAYLAIPDRYIERVNGFDLSGYSPIAPYNKFHPITDKIRQVDVFGGYTAATGHALYTARQFPSEYWNRAAFINEPTGNLVHQGFLRQEGAHFVIEDGWNMMASADEWASPVMSEVGPDGALWVLDWYNLIIQHNPVPEGFKEGEGDAYETPLRDLEHGRIYRIAHKESSEYLMPPLSKDDPEGLIAALKHSNLFWRQTAQRLLVERGTADVADALINLVNDQSVDDIGINGGAVHALWTLHGLNELSGSNAKAKQAALNALAHPASGVRRAALQVLPADSLLWHYINLENVLYDNDPLVILQVLLKLSEIPSNTAAGKALYDLQNQQAISNDRWLPTALAIAAAQHHEGYLAALLSDQNPDIRREITQIDLPNASFEEADGNLPVGWDVEPYTWPLAESNPNIYNHAIVTEGRTGNALQISSPTGADVGIYVTVPVKPNTDYMLSGWIKTKNVSNVGGGYGAVIDILTFGRTRTIRGTSDWTWVEKRFNTGNKTEIRIQCHLGRWGQYKGTSWFDDLRLVELGDVSPAAVVAETIFRHIGAGGLAGPAADVLFKLPDADPAVQELAMASFVDNWPVGKPLILEPKHKKTIKSQLSSPLQAQLELLLNRAAGSIEQNPDQPAGMYPILLQAEVNTLRFVQDTLTVKAGQWVELTFENPDVMAHNVVIGEPGSLEAIGAAADVLASSPDGLAQDYIPQLESIIIATSLIAAGEQTRVTFQVPDIPGDYPFACTFPGHWRLMNGILRVSN